MSELLFLKLYIEIGYSCVNYSDKPFWYANILDGKYIENNRPLLK